MNVSPFLWLACAFLGYYLAYGVVVPYLPVWVKSQQYGAEIIGLVMSSSYLFRFVGSFFFGSQVKKTSQLLPILRITAWLMVCSTILMAFFAESFWGLFCSIALFSILNAGGMPLTDSLAATWQKQISIDYGRARLIGSTAFTMALIIVGQIIGIIGEQQIIWILTALFVFYAMVLLINPAIQVKDNAAESDYPRITFIGLLKDKLTRRVLLSACLVQGSHAGYYVYSILYWNEQGIPVQTTSLLWGLAVIAEITLFFFSARLFKRWSVARLMTFATIGAVIRWSGYSLSVSLWVITPLQLFHCLTFALLHFAMMRYIVSQPQQHIVKLQSLYNGLSGCMSVAIMTVIAGWLYKQNASVMFAVMAGVAALALLTIPRGSRVS